MKEENERPWGRYDVVSKTKIIYIDPNKRLSLQLHKHRDEYWTILKGEGEVQIGEVVYPAKEGDNFHVPKGEKHRVMAGEQGMSFLEIAVGLVDEDDIVRLEDDHGRIE